MRADWLQTARYFLGKAAAARLAGDRPQWEQYLHTAQDARRRFTLSPLQ